MPVFIAGIFSFIADLFRKLSFELVLKVTASTIYISLAVLTFSLFVVLAYYAINIILFVFNQTNLLIDDLDALASTPTAGNDLIGAVFSVFSVFGIFKAFNDVFALFSPTLIAYFVFKLSSLLYVFGSKILKSYSTLYHILK